MAYKTKAPEAWVKASPNTAKLPFLLNLDSAVGERAANRADDVMLVQWILMTALAAPKPFPYLPDQPGGGARFLRLGRPIPNRHGEHGDAARQ
jgi:hypothetical protein